MSTKPRFKTCVLAAIIAALPLFSDAAGLGRLNVMSGLGQPFRGEIELVAVQPSEMESLKVKLASAEAYTAAQMIYPSNALGLRLALDKAPNGQYVVKVSSSGSVDEPVFNLLVDLSWLGGSIQREYTALIDPVGYSAMPGGATISTLPASKKVEISQASANPTTKPAVLPVPKVDESSAKVAPAKTEKPAAKTESTSSSDEQADYKVKAGDTLSAIARKVQPEGVSLDQVLLGLYQANKHAFNGNMNRLNRGKILQIPTKNDFTKIDPNEAAKEIKAHSANWSNYRRQLAEAATKTPGQGEGAQAAGGRITAKVEDKGLAATEAKQDVLKISRGASGADEQKNRVRALEEEAAARKKALDEANQRVAELQKNIQEMEKLVALKNKTAAELQKKAEVAPTAVPTIAPTVAPILEVAASEVAASEVAASEVVVATQVPVVEASPEPKPKRVAPVVLEEQEPSLVDSLIDNALYIGGGLLVLLLGGVGVMVSRNRRRPSVFENSLITSGDLKPNTVLGRTGGGVISTQAENSFLTDFSRQGLGTIDTDEVDPIAEADVYMAYGRNAQAEEILKDALAKDPHRQEIRVKLLEIFAARKDKTAFEEVAADLFAETNGAGAFWEQAAYLGQSVDPENPLYSAAKQGAAIKEQESSEQTSEFVTDAESPSIEADVSEEATPSLDFEFDAPESVLSDVQIKLDSEDESASVDVMSDENAALDMSFDLEPSVSNEVVETSELPTEELDAGMLELDIPVELDAPEQLVSDAELDFDFNESESDALSTTLEDARLTEMPDLDLNLDLGADSSSDFVDENEVDAEAKALAEFNAQLASMDGMSELSNALSSGEALIDEAQGTSEESEVDLDFGFDLNEELADVSSNTDASSIDLEMEIGGGSADNMDFTADDPVQTKIDLARAYIDMGDVEGAREILQEAEQEGNASQQEQARTLLTNL